MENGFKPRYRVPERDLRLKVVRDKRTLKKAWSTRRRSRCRRRRSRDSTMRRGREERTRFFIRRTSSRRAHCRGYQRDSATSASCRGIRIERTFQCRAIRDCRTGMAYVHRSLAFVTLRNNAKQFAWRRADRRRDSAVDVLLDPLIAPAANRVSDQIDQCQVLRSRELDDVFHFE